MKTHTEADSIPTQHGVYGRCSAVLRAEKGIDMAIITLTPKQVVLLREVIRIGLRELDMDILEEIGLNEEDIGEIGNIHAEMDGIANRTSYKGAEITIMKY